MGRPETHGTAFYLFLCTRAQDNKNPTNNPSTEYDDTLRNQDIFMKMALLKSSFSL
jgi:hypothetical protein